MELSNIAFEHIIDNFYYGNIGDFRLVIDKNTGFFNATKLCKIGNKQYKNWFRLERTTELISYLEKSDGSHVSRHFYEIRGNQSETRTKIFGTYIQKELFLDLASWISPEFYIKCNQIVLEYFGSLEKERYEQIIKEKEKEIQNNKEALVRKERFIKNAKGLIENIQYKQKKLEWIYIGSTDKGRSERIYKIGSTERLACRLGTYNTGRSDDELFQYNWVKQVYKSKQLDYVIQNLLLEFKYKESAELYKSIKFKDLVEIVDYICENYDKSYEMIAAFVNTRLKPSLEEDEDDVPILDPKNVIIDYGNGIQEKFDATDELKQIVYEYLKRVEEKEVLRKDILNQVKCKWIDLKSALDWKSSKVPINVCGKEVFVKY